MIDSVRLKQIDAFCQLNPLYKMLPVQQIPICCRDLELFAFLPEGKLRIWISLLQRIRTNMKTFHLITFLPENIMCLLSNKPETGEGFKHISKEN